MKTEAYKLYSRVLRFLPNVIKINPYNLSYTVLKLAHILRHSVDCLQTIVWACVHIKVTKTKIRKRKMPILCG